MGYRVKEIFHTLQGEGVRSGRSAVFCRFAGCNLWSGREAQRATAVCRLCDTDFVGTDGRGGGTFPTAGALAEAVDRCWQAAVGVAPARSRGYVVCTGGEPLLQLDAPAVAALHDAGFEVAVETNGTLPVPAGVDWVCVSPKAGSEVVVRRGDELKLVFEQPGAPPERFEDWEFEHFVLQPMDGPEVARHTAAAVEHCRRHPRWRLGLQIHKVLGIP
jgi:7-carboxy-7-deazaguanine synthase (Cx14CxxC type)